MWRWIMEEEFLYFEFTCPFCGLGWCGDDPSDFCEGCGKVGIMVARNDGKQLPDFDAEMRRLGFKKHGECEEKK
jgi:hypothetical protein